MKVLVCVVASQDNIAEAVNTQRNRLIPHDLFRGKTGPDYPINFKVSMFNPSTMTMDFNKFLLQASRSMDAVILLVENNHSHLLSAVRDAVFAATFETQQNRIENFKNFFGSFFSPLFRNFFSLKTLASDTDKEQTMMLPLRNFDAQELRELARLSREESRSSNLLYNLEACVAAISKRRIPRRKSTSNIKYFIDDKKMHFVYGHENHSRFDTGHPHVAACEINGLFRFGKSIDSERHYNASFGVGDDTIIHGEFPDCHGAIKTIPKHPRKTHLNMFANDFC